MKAVDLLARLSHRLWAQVDRSGGPDVCWPWTGGVNEDGYGRFMLDYKSYQAHRVVLALKLGRLPPRRYVTRHTCVGNRRCCNPSHVAGGTIAQNNHDLSTQDRVAYGERSNTAKLTEGQVIEIRTLAATMGYGKYELLGRRYGVTGREISYICNGRKWQRARSGVAA